MGSNPSKASLEQERTSIKRRPSFFHSTNLQPKPRVKCLQEHWHGQAIINSHLKLINAMAFAFVQELIPLRRNIFYSPMKFLPHLNSFSLFPIMVKDKP